jgi:hypothetical protein
MSKALCCAALSLFSFLGLAQSTDWSNYKVLEAKGPVPSDFTRNLQRELAKSEKKSNTYKDRTERYRAEQFYLQSAYEIQGLLNSGRISYGDTVTNYCRAVLDKVLADFPDLKKKIRLYLNKNPQHNAFTTDEGIIFVNTGLLSQLETEAQLAFVLAHEVVHYAEKHVIDEYLELERIKDGDDDYEDATVDEKISSISRFSKDSELEADELGYKRYYKNTGYSLEAPNQLMDIMLYSYLPFNEVPVSTDFLNIASLTIPPSFFKEEVASISAIEDYDDSESSHPNIKKRRSTMKQISFGDAGGEDFLISEAAFMHVRKISRYENTRLFLSYRDYERAIYNAYLLRTEDKESKFLKTVIANSLYAFSAYSNEDELTDVQVDYEEIEGESQQVYFLLDKLTQAQRNVVAMAWVLALKEEYPDDAFIQQMYEETLDGLVYENDFVYEDFSSESYDDVKARVEAQMAQDSSAAESNSKVANIKKKKREEEGTVGDNFVKYALSAFISDSTLRHDFNARDEIKEEKESIKNYRNRYNRDNDDLYDENLALGLDKVLIVNPRYLNLEMGVFGEGLDREKSVENVDKYRTHIHEISRDLNLRSEMLTHEMMSTAEQYNHHAALSMWLNERMRHVNSGVLVSEYNHVKDARKYYETDHLVFTGNYTIKESDFNPFGKVMEVLCVAVVYPFYPYYFSSAFSPDYESFNYYYVFDLETGQAILAENTYYKDPDETDYIKSMLYNNLLQTKAKP